MIKAADSVVSLARWHLFSPLIKLSRISNISSRQRARGRQRRMRGTVGAREEKRHSGRKGGDGGRGRGKERISLEALCSRCPDTFLQRGLVRQEKRHVSRHHVHTSSLRGHRYETRFLRLSLSVAPSVSISPSYAFTSVVLRYLPSSRSLFLLLPRLFVFLFAAVSSEIPTYR